jgi:hypothetical protein
MKTPLLPGLGSFFFNRAATFICGLYACFSKRLKEVELGDFFVDIGPTDCLDSQLAADRVGYAVCADNASCDDRNGFFEAVECNHLRGSICFCGLAISVAELMHGYSFLACFFSEGIGWALQPLQATPNSKSPKPQ